MLIVLGIVVGLCALHIPYCTLILWCSAHAASPHIKPWKTKPAERQQSMAMKNADLEPHCLDSVPGAGLSS